MSDDERIHKALLEAGIAEKITCVQAFAIAEMAGIPPVALGKYCTKNRIKIHGCQLGCFK